MRNDTGTASGRRAGVGLGPLADLFAQHSGTARRPFREQFARVVPARYGSAVHASVAHWRQELVRSAPVILEGPYRWVRHPLYACTLALFWIRPKTMGDGLLLSALWSA